MGHLRNTVTLVLGYLLILLFVPFTTQAYLDPGAGSYVVQVLVAGLLAIGVTVRVYWRSISRFARRLLGREPESTEGTPDEH